MTRPVPMFVIVLACLLSGVSIGLILAPHIAPSTQTIVVQPASKK